MRQLSLLTAETRRQKPQKRQRQTAREVYRQQRAQDIARAQAGKETREGMVLRCLAAHWNEWQNSPTALELFVWMSHKNERVMDINSVRPRLTKLVSMGLIEASTKRLCMISKKRVHTWRVREIGS